MQTDRFVEYEKKDEGWCRTLGMGQEEDVEVEIPITEMSIKRLDNYMEQTWGLLCKNMGLVPIFQHAETYKLKYYK